MILHSFENSICSKLGKQHVQCLTLISFVAWLIHTYFVQLEKYYYVSPLSQSTILKLAEQGKPRWLEE